MLVNKASRSSASLSQVTTPNSQLKQAKTISQPTPNKPFNTLVIKCIKSTKKTQRRTLYPFSVQSIINVNLLTVTIIHLIISFIDSLHTTPLSPPLHRRKHTVFFFLGGLSRRQISVLLPHNK